MEYDILKSDKKRPRFTERFVIISTRSVRYHSIICLTQLILWRWHLDRFVFTAKPERTGWKIEFL